jgi:hypothetical protein
VTLRPPPGAPRPPNANVSNISPALPSSKSYCEVERPFPAVGTDGSARPPNPGPDGAGTVIQWFDARGALLTTTTIYAG